MQPACGQEETGKVLSIVISHKVPQLASPGCQSDCVLGCNAVAASGLRAQGTCNHGSKISKRTFWLAARQVRTLQRVTSIALQGAGTQTTAWLVLGPRSDLDLTGSRACVLGSSRDCNGSRFEGPRSFKSLEERHKKGSRERLMTK